ncbi:MAG: hypothetical protein JXE06_04175 [Coriobacteriia bacterium]|nr:hypothetical protein [Coriobacteriia bacterium]MBN2821773.1 hypothetical protein [Coriobacteriia bacterium]
MARRSAGNDRYRTESKGQTRKSAGSMKPKREKGSIDTTMPKKGSGSSKSAAKNKQVTKKKYMPVPTTPEIKKWRKVWWVAIIIALLAFGVAYLGESQDNNTLRTVGLSIELAGVLVAINIDIFVIRRLRKEAILAEQKGKTPKASKSEKSAKSEKPEKASKAEKPGKASESTETTEIDGGKDIS